jgi:hypothetical protein
MMCNHRGRQMIAGFWWALLPCASGSVLHRRTRIPATSSIGVLQTTIAMSAAIRGVVISARVIIFA